MAAESFCNRYGWPMPGFDQGALKASDSHMCRPLVETGLGYNEKPVQHKATFVVTDAGDTVKDYLKHCIILSLKLTADVCRPMLEIGWDTMRIPSRAT